MGPIVTQKGNFGRNKVPMMREEIVINPETFNATKANPIVQGKFKLYSNQKRTQLWVISEQDGTAQSKSYELRSGSLFLVEKNGELYSYFRTDEFKQFLTKYGLTRVRNTDPNGEYLFREGMHKTDTDSCAMATDGQWEVHYETKLESGESQIYSCRHGNKYVTVTGASFVIAQQATFRPVTTGDANGNELTFFQRELITSTRVENLDPKLLEEKVKGMDTYLASLRNLQ